MHADDLARRIDALERHNRRLKLVGVSVLIAVASLASLASRPVTRTSPEDVRAGTVTAERVIILEEDGWKGAELGPEHLTIYDESGTPRARLARSRAPNLVALTMFDDEGRMRAIVQSNADGYSTVSFHDAEGKGRANLAVGADGRVGLTMADGERVRARMWTPGDDGRVELDLLTASDKVRWTTAR